MTSLQGSVRSGAGPQATPHARQRPACRQPLGPHRTVPRAATAEDSPAVGAGHNNSSSNGAAPSNPLDFDELTDIIRMVQDTDIVELELKGARFSLALRKKEALEAAEPTVLYQQPAQQSAQFAAPPPPQFNAPAPMGMPQAPPGAGAGGPQGAGAPAPPPAAPPAEQPGAASEDGVTQASPMAGTMYRAPAPGEPAFVKEGDAVKKGQTICIIEAMKLMNEIEADTDGTIVKFIADNGSPITIGQPLVSIKPS